MFIQKTMKTIRQVIILLVIISQAGCYVTKGFVPIVEQTSFETLPANVNLSMDLTHIFDGERVTGSQNQQRLDYAKGVSEKVLRESKLFRSAEYNMFNSDLSLNFEVKEVEKGSMTTAAISGLSMMLIPVKTGANFEVKATLKDKTGNLIGTYDSKSDFNVILHLLFILPIGWRFGIPDQAYEAMFQDIMDQISSDRDKILNAIGTA